jgi:Kef-type K+ transport system membrane component KefB
MSIREQLNIALIIALVVITVTATCMILALFFGGYGLSTEAYAQIISALATVVVIILTLGLRLIDDTLTRYEKIVKPKISSLIQSLAGSYEGDLKSLMSNYTINLGDRPKEISRKINSITRHGSFFFTKLYPSEPLKRTEAILDNLEKYQSAITQLNDLCNFSNDYAFREFIEMIAENTECSEKWAALQFSNRNLVKEKRPELCTQVKTSRDKIIQEIENLTNELNDFLDAN